MSGNPLLLWGAIVISVLNSLAFLGSLLIAYLSKDQANLALLIGAVIANMASTLSFWIGSTAGSARKTELLAAALTQPPAVPAAGTPAGPPEPRS